MILPRTPSVRRQLSGFTLVELLTVIAIIAILMGILLPTVAVVKQSAKKAQAKSDAVMIVNAIEAFYTEYGHYPLPDSVDPGPNDVIFGDSNDGGSYTNSQIMDVLRAREAEAGIAADKIVNFRNKVFTEGVVAKKEGRYGIQEDGTFLDPWGIPYVIAMDTSYSKVTETFMDAYSDATYVTIPPEAPGIRAGAIVYSFGKDGQQGTKGDNRLSGSDDIVSWK